ncbi:solute carrier family 22 member 1-like [Chrysoperla carnea]|uniref:solute carrier family 22 member 1-like n=1 Tax=Chrysoperla carnea TaxID=189513 RepID=UPI001D066C1E|nr:solute carrier family 22 member 1-like [Chrysoperla carnea]
MSEFKQKTTNIDEILKQLGWFGRYQQKRWILFIIIIWVLLLTEFSYVFSTINPKYRCLVPDCETASNTEYKPVWLSNAVPFKGKQPSRCKRFQIKADKEHRSTGECDSDLFNYNVIEDCDEFVYDTKHTTIIQDFNLLCEKVWMIAIPGSLHAIALFLALPTTGYIADRIGRKKVIIFGVVLGGLFCFIKSFSISISMFVICEFLQAASAGGSFTSVYTLIAEFTPAENRLLGCVISFGCLSLAQMSIAGIAWMSNSWRLFLRLVTIPTALVLFFMPFFLPESIRWLISQNKISEATAILENIAQENGTELKEEHKLQLKVMLDNSKDSNKIRNESLKDVFKSIPMVIRLVTCSICWISCTFIYHGLFIMAGEISGYRYLNFILVGLAEMPGSIICYVSCNRYGRRLTMSVGLITVGICCGFYIFIPDGHWLRLIMFLLSKSAITAALGTLYIIVAEMYPTSFRVTLINGCSMFGRIGQLITPTMPILATYWNILPILIFSLVSTTAGFLSLILPETLNTTLPDTIEEAVNINKKTVINPLLYG